MRWRSPLAAAMATLLVAGTGCTSLREIPPSQYQQKPERQNVRVTTKEGLVYEFDFARLEGDTLVGFRQRDVPGVAQDFATLRIPLDEVSRLYARSVDWLKTGGIAAAVVAGVAVAGIASDQEEPDDAAGGGGGSIRPPD